MPQPLSASGAPSQFSWRGKRENGIQSNEEEAKLFNLMDEMNVCFLSSSNLIDLSWRKTIELLGYRPEASLRDVIDSINFFKLIPSTPLALMFDNKEKTSASC